MNAIEVAAWHRDRAKQLTKEANEKLAEAKTHEEMASKLAPAITARPRPLPFAQTVTIESLRRYLKTNGGRVAHVAAHFRVGPSVIQALIDTEGSGVVVAPRGWLKLSAPQSDLPTQS